MGNRSDVGFSEFLFIDMYVKGRINTACRTIYLCGMSLFYKSSRNSFINKSGPSLVKIVKIKEHSKTNL